MAGEGCWRSKGKGVSDVTDRSSLWCPALREGGLNRKGSWFGGRNRTDGTIFKQRLASVAANTEATSLLVRLLLAFSGAKTNFCYGMVCISSHLDLPKFLVFIGLVTGCGVSADPSRRLDPSSYCLLTSQHPPCLLRNLSISFILWACFM